MPTLPTITTLTDPLSLAEKVEYEQMIERLRKSQDPWFVAGRLLIEIQYRHLYREHHVDFETFCLVELRKRESHVIETINRTLVAEILVASGITPSCESHFRPLTWLTDPAEQILAYRRAVARAQKAGTRLTTGDVCVEVNQIRDAAILKRRRIDQIGRRFTRVLETFTIEQLEGFTKTLLAFAEGWKAVQPEPAIPRYYQTVHPEDIPAF